MFLGEVLLCPRVPRLVVPTCKVWLRWTILGDSYGFLHVGDLWTAIVHQIGDPGPHVQVAAALPAPVIVQSCVSATLANGDNLTAVQATHVGLLWRTPRKLVHFWAGLPDTAFRDVEQWRLADPSVMLVVKARALLQRRLAVDK